MREFVLFFISFKSFFFIPSDASLSRSLSRNLNLSRSSEPEAQSTFLPYYCMNKHTVDAYTHTIKLYFFLKNSNFRFTSNSNSYFFLLFFPSLSFFSFYFFLFLFSSLFSPFSFTFTSFLFLSFLFLSFLFISFLFISFPSLYFFFPSFHMWADYGLRRFGNNAPKRIAIRSADK